MQRGWFWDGTWTPAAEPPLILIKKRLNWQNNLAFSPYNQATTPACPRLLACSPAAGPSTRCVDHIDPCRAVGPTPGVRSCPAPARGVERGFRSVVIGPDWVSCPKWQSHGVVVRLTFSRITEQCTHTVLMCAVSAADAMRWPPCHPGAPYYKQQCTGARAHAHSFRVTTHLFPPSRTCTAQSDLQHSV